MLTCADILWHTQTENVRVCILFNAADIMPWDEGGIERIVPLAGGSVRLAVSGNRTHPSYQSPTVMSAQARLLARGGAAWSA